MTPARISKLSTSASASSQSSCSLLRNPCDSPRRYAASAIIRQRSALLICRCTTAPAATFFLGTDFLSTVFEGSESLGFVFSVEAVFFVSGVLLLAFLGTVFAATDFLAIGFSVDAVAFAFGGLALTFFAAAFRWVVFLLTALAPDEPASADMCFVVFAMVYLPAKEYRTERIKQIKQGSNQFNEMA
jgi:hypothetical protein